MVSEDEFPAENVKQLDTEAVSDEELQEMPADALGTEDVSDDELPPPVKKKRKHRHHSSSGESMGFQCRAESHPGINLSIWKYKIGFFFFNDLVWSHNCLYFLFLQRMTTHHQTKTRMGRKRRENMNPLVIFTLFS